MIDLDPYGTVAPFVDAAIQARDVLRRFFFLAALAVFGRMTEQKLFV